MTTRHPDHPTFARGLRSIAASVIAVLVPAVTITAIPAPAQAAIPAVARTWSDLMYRSLTSDPAVAKLRSTLAAQQAAFATRVAELAAAKSANAAAQTQLTPAIAADASARTRYTAAVQALAAANKALARVSAQRPRSRAAVTQATNAVTAATKTVNDRRTVAQRAGTVLKSAQAGARTATTGLNSAIAAWRAASAAVRQTQQKLAAAGNATVLAGQAAAISRDVVTQVRAGFTVADTTTVYGVTVHKSVAYAFRRMLDDAKADGIVLSGGGFRTMQRQIELRTINGCPDVWTAPASSCRVPTAIPGRSLHEIGLAVDVTSGGRTLTAKSAGFTWLAAHAAGYGFVNLPSEPWHWSITGS